MRFFIILSFLLFFSCNLADKPNYRSSEKEKIADELIKRASVEIQKNTGLIPIGSGARMMNEIKMLSLSFECRKNVDIESGRKLLIKATEELLSQINQSEKIKKYLITHPFTSKDIQILIFIKNQDRTKPAPGSLVVVSSVGGEFNYEIDDPEGPLFKIVHKETHEEAQEKLHLHSSREYE